MFKLKGGNKMQGSQYVPISASAVRTFVAPPSSDNGYYLDGLYVNYDYDLGFTGKGWSKVLDIENNPFGMYPSYRFTDDVSFREYLKKYQNFNLVFRHWNETITNPVAQYLVLVTMGNEQYFGSTSNLGCIGDQLYS